MHVIRRKPIRFVVTSKTAKSGNYLAMVKVQMAMIALYLVAILYSLSLYIIGERIYLTGYVVNLMWSFFNVISLWAIVKAAQYKFEG